MNIDKITQGTDMQREANLLASQMSAVSKYMAENTSMVTSMSVVMVNDAGEASKFEFTIPKLASGESDAIAAVSAVLSGVVKAADSAASAMVAEGLAE